MNQSEFSAPSPIASGTCRIFTPWTSPGLYVKNISYEHHVLKQCLAGFKLPSNALTFTVIPTVAICTCTCTGPYTERSSILAFQCTGCNSGKTLSDLLLQYIVSGTYSKWVGYGGHQLYRTAIDDEQLHRLKYK